ncbi:MAG: membrane protein insertion efficiency factor YidD [Vicinamibacterales bacterium]
MPPIPALNPISAPPLNGVPPGCSRHPMSPAPNSGRVSSAVMRPSDLSRGQRVALALIRSYKVLISPMFAGSCRYLPSCSDYAAEAIHRFGVVRGTMLAAARLARCHPLGGHGLDAVPADTRNSR